MLVTTLNIIYKSEREFICCSFIIFSSHLILFPNIREPFFMLHLEHWSLLVWLPYCFINRLWTFAKRISTRDIRHWKFRNIEAHTIYSTTGLKVSEDVFIYSLVWGGQQPYYHLINTLSILWISCTSLKSLQKIQNFSLTFLLYLVKWRLTMVWFGLV